MDIQILIAFLGGVSILLLLILAFKINAFISLLISSISVGLIAGMKPTLIIDTVIQGMGNTLGYVAIIIGLGAILGAVLEHSGATEKLANWLIDKAGEKNAPSALAIAGFFIAIPVFFDVAFIILVPVLYALHKKTKKSLLLYAIPLLAGLAVTHAFIPPTPGPIAVADIIGADLGWIILLGFGIGIPVTIVSGIIFGKYISEKINVGIPTNVLIENKKRDYNPPIGLIFGLILLPIILIIIHTILKGFYEENTSWLIETLKFIGHPIIALIISTLAALYFLGVRYNVPGKTLQKISMDALGPAGIIILITGAGGVFKQMLIETKAGEMIATQMTSYQIPLVLLAFTLALIVRLLQGSATVAMITGAGIMAPILENMELSPQGLALIVLSIAAGATGFSHVNDSGFWLVNRYLGLTEIQTVRSWTLMTGIIAITSILIIAILYGVMV